MSEFGKKLMLGIVNRLSEKTSGLVVAGVIAGVVLDSRDRGVKPTRRQFLQWGALTTAAVGLAGCGQRMDMGVEDKNVPSEVVSSEETTEKNENYRPMVEIIREGCNEYKEKTGENPYYQRSDNYLDVMTVLMSMYISKDEVPKLEVARSVVEEQRGVKLSDEEYLSEINLRLFNWAYKFIDEYLPNNLNPELRAAGIEFSASRELMGNLANFGFCGVAVRNEYDPSRVISELSQTRMTVEGWVDQNGGMPISSSRLLSYYLDLNHGDLARSLWDINFFLKFTSRNNWENGKFEVKETNARWMAANILDEYSLFGPDYKELTEDLPPDSLHFNCHPDFLPTCDKDKDPANQIGLPYHAFGMVAGLSHFDPQLIVARFWYDQKVNSGTYGPVKIEASTQIAIGLGDIDKFIMVYKK